MLKKLYLVISLLIFSSPLTFANNEEVKFSIKNIRVDEVANSSSLARKKAIKYAEKYALKKTLSSLTENIDINSISEEKISSLINVMEFHSEEITDIRYKALIDVHFNKERFEFFIKNDLLNGKIKKLKLLLIPVLNENGLIKLWQQGNIWLAGWKENKLSNIIEIKIPLGDINDINLLNLDSLENMTSEDIFKLKAEYDVDKIVISNLEYSYGFTDNLVYFKSYLKDINQKESTILAARSEGAKEDNYSKHIEYLIKQTISNLETGWISYNNNSTSSTKHEFVVKIKSLDDWVTIKKNLNDLNIVKNYKVTSFASRYAKIEIDFTEKPIELLELMKDLGFQIYREGGFVILKTN